MPVIDQTQAEQKLKELILYIAARSADDPSFGAVKLNKLLYRCDFGAFQDLGEPITGVEYVRLREGPAPRRLLPVRRAMEEANEIVLWKKPLPGQHNAQERIVPRREPLLDLFTSREIVLIDSVVQECWSKTGKQLSDESHGELGWRLASDGEPIPYEVSLVESVSPTDAPRSSTDGYTATRSMHRLEPSFPIRNDSTSSFGVLSGFLPGGTTRVASH